MENGLHRLTLPLLDHLVNESISDLAQYSGLVLTICLVVVFLVRFYVFEAFLMERLYGEKYTNMTNESVRRGFVNHHVATLIKLVLFVTAGYPFIAVMGGAKMHSPYNGQGGQVTMGDVLVVCSQLFVTMYTFELFYRSKISLVSALHHMGAIIIAESAVAMSLDFEHHKVDSAIEFMLCFVWGKQYCPRVASPQRLSLMDQHIILLLSRTVTDLLASSRRIRCPRRALAPSCHNSVPALPREARVPPQDFLRCMLYRVGQHND